MAIQAQLYPNNLGFPLCGSQDLVFENGHATVGLAQSCFNSQQKHHQLQQQQGGQNLRQLYNKRQRNQNQNQNMFVDTNLLFSSNSKPNVQNPASMPISQTLALQFQKQSQDIDRYIRLQNEKLRIMLEEQRKQQVATLLKKAESDALYLLRQKDEEIAQAAKKKVELEEFLRRLEQENQAWKKVAQEKEAMVLSLHNTLEEMKERGSFGLNNGVGTEDAGSCCNEEERGKKEIEEEKEEREEKKVGSFGFGGGVGGDVEVEQSTRKKMVCKSCDSGRACFLFLPCRHLCSCKACEALLQACPVCGMPKKASIETLIF